MNLGFGATDNCFSKSGCGPGIGEGNEERVWGSSESRDCAGRTWGREPERQTLMVTGLPGAPGLTPISLITSIHRYHLISTGP